MFGSIYNQPEPPALDIGRNVSIINLGSVYLNLDTHKKKGRLLESILNKRLKNTKNFKGTIADWLGKTSYPGGRSLSRALHDIGTRKNTYYHGVDCLLKICSGDYSEMISMVGAIFREANVADGKKPRLIEKKIQHKAITKVSSSFLGQARFIKSHDIDLYCVVDAFGNLSKNLLYNRPLVYQGKDKKGKRRQDPYDLLTIYVDDLPQSNSKAKKTWEYLQRSSIFVDIGIAPSQRRPIADCATLRRIYCPAFKTTLSTSERRQLTKDDFEYFMDEPYEYCETFYKKVMKFADQPSMFDNENRGYNGKSEEIDIPVHIPEKKEKISFVDDAPNNWHELVSELPELLPLKSNVKPNERYDIFIGAMGFEDRTLSAVTQLKELNVRVNNAILYEFDLFLEANYRWRNDFEKILVDLTEGRPYRPHNAPLGVADSTFSARLKSLLSILSKTESPKILFDCTSCPSLITSKTLAVLFKMECELTILYSEAERYFPSREDWESGKVKPYNSAIKSPFKGIRFVDAPPILQSDDVGEEPTLLVLFPTFNTERTGHIINHMNPARRIWIFGKPHDQVKNGHHIEMRKLFAAPNIHPGDTWSIVPTFDYRETMRILGGITYKYRSENRIFIMPHGSKMQTIGVGLFATSHEISMVFGVPQTYNADGVSGGTLKVWALHLNDTKRLINKLRANRVIFSET